MKYIYLERLFRHLSLFQKISLHREALHFCLDTKTKQKIQGLGNSPKMESNFLNISQTLHFLDLFLTKIRFPFLTVNHPRPILKPRSIIQASDRNKQNLTIQNNVAFKTFAKEQEGRSTVAKVFSDEFLDTFYGEKVSCLDSIESNWKLLKTFSLSLARAVALLVSLLFSYLTVTPAYGQETVGQGEVKPLKVGDTIPEELWDLEIPVLSHNGNKSTLTLRDYSDGVIILDFWGTWCSVCIQEFPKLFELKRQFDSPDFLILPVVMQSEDVVRSTMERSTINTISDFTSALDDGYLLTLFPTEEYPHVVVLKEGKVTAITKTEYLDKDRLISLSNGKKLYMPTKIGMEEVRNRSLLTPMYAEFHQYKPVYYGSLMGFQDGLKTTLIYENNESHTRFMIANTGLWLMYEQAYGFKGDQRVLEISTFPNRRIVLLDSPARYFDWRPISQYSKVERSSIMKNYYYTYEVYLPPSMDKEQVRSRFAEDLDKFLGVSTAVEMLSVNCLVLYPLNATVKSSEGARSKGYRIARYLNNPTFKLPPVICSDELSSQLVDRLTLEDRPYELSELNILLKSYGLVLDQGTRMLDMFVVRNVNDRQNKLDFSTLQLGKYGYEKGGNQ